VGDIFRSKFFIILLIIACVLTLSTVILNLAGYGSVVSDITNIILTPFQKFADIIKTSFSGFIGYFTEFNRMKEEIEDYKARLEIAEALSEDTRKMKEQIEIYENFYEFKKEHMDFKFQPAKIIARAPGNYLSAATINKGSFHEIEKDMPVIASKGADIAIVGYISEVSLLSAKVVSFIRTGDAIGAYIEGSEQTGVVEGDFELEKEGLCRFTVQSKEVEFEVGDRIFSSGNGGIYPDGLYIGEVIEVSPDPLSHTMTGIIRPAVNFGDIKDVMVVLKFDRMFY